MVVAVTAVEASNTTNSRMVRSANALHNYAIDGALLGKIHLPEPASNLTFGGPELTDSS